MNKKIKKNVIKELKRMIKSIEDNHIDVTKVELHRDYSTRLGEFGSLEYEPLSSYDIKISYTKKDK